ncbi:MAG: PA-phosphatase [Mycobacterium sp.]|nr:PA-phosphatase [Mycobacterium sp.]
MITGSRLTAAAAVRWWPPIALTAMVVLGIAVGKASTPLDDWFLYEAHIRWLRPFLLFFVEPRVLMLLYALGVVIALWQRRWLMATLAAVAPVVALITARLCKMLFGREIDHILAYPSGHVTVMTTVLGMLVLVAHRRVWAIVAATFAGLAGMLGASTTFHYFTDAVGAVLLGTAVVCVVIVILDRRRARLDAT